MNLFLRTEDKQIVSADTLTKISKDVTKSTNVESNIKLVKEELHALGGVKVVRDDNLLFIDNTFDTRLERSKNAAREALVELLVE